MSIGGSQLFPDFGTTKNRATRVIFDSVCHEIEEPTYVLQRNAGDMCRVDREKSLDNGKITMLGPDIGFAVTNSWTERSTLIENNESADAWLTASDVQLASAFEEIFTWKKPDATDFPGLTTGADPNISTQGGRFFQKKVGAGDSWISQVTDTYVLPDLGQNNIALDKVMVTNEVDNEWRDLHFEFTMPQTIGYDGKVLIALGFVGPAGAYGDGSINGTGQYFLACYASGEAKLYEKRSNDSWVERAKFRIAPKGTFFGQGWIHITKVPYDKTNAAINGQLLFRSSYGVGDAVNVSEITWINSAIAPMLAAKDAFIYICPGIDNGTNQGKIPSVATANRVAIRRDLLIPFNIAVAKKHATATLVDDPFTIPSTFRQWTGSEPIIPSTWLMWTTHSDGSGSVEMKLFTEDGVEIVPVSSGANWKEYKLLSSHMPNGVGTFFAKAIFTTNGSHSPILVSYRVSRQGFQAEVNYGGTPKTAKVRSVQLMGPEKDPQQSYVNVVIADHTNQLDLLRSRGSIPIDLAITVNPEDLLASKIWCRLFKGYTRRVDATRKVRVLNATDGVGHPFYVYNVQAVSMFQRLREMVNPLHMPLFAWPGVNFTGPTNSIALKVTDVIRSLISSCGFPDSMINIPDLEARFFVTGNGIHQTIDALAEIGSTIITFLEEYLGHFLVFDENAGDHGKWTLVAPSIAPYTPKAEFHFSVPGGEGPAHSRLTAEPPTDLAGRRVAHIKKGTFKSWVKPPEANVIIVSGAFKTTPTGVPEHLYQVFPNYKSADFGNGLVDPTHPDYLGRVVPMYVMLPELASFPITTDGAGNQEHVALNWIGRRIYDVAAHAIKTVTFEAPLVLIPHEDANDPPNKFRPLRYYDPVLVDGETFLIRNVNPTYTKDFHQMAVYECEAPRI